MRFSPAESLILKNQSVILMALANLSFGHSCSKYCSEQARDTEAALKASAGQDEFGRLTDVTPPPPFVDLRTRPVCDDCDFSTGHRCARHGGLR